MGELAANRILSANNQGVYQDGPEAWAFQGMIASDSRLGPGGHYPGGRLLPRPVPIGFQAGSKQ